MFSQFYKKLMLPGFSFDSFKILRIGNFFPSGLPVFCYRLFTGIIQGQPRTDSLKITLQLLKSVSPS
ncbi:MAG: hypothetical protein P9L92_04365, partial [Candidatus Electryonea clarkiae]|nr:hypothetical protein [Candidatus Electryonea clarkiae]